MESEREQHLRRIVEAIDELERSDPSPRVVIDLVVERRKREAGWRPRLPQLPRPGGSGRERKE
jgi:hypothetical protein